jgi:hypothetical protein
MPKPCKVQIDDTPLQEVERGDNTLVVRRGKKQQYPSGKKQYKWRCPSGKKKYKH